VDRNDRAKGSRAEEEVMKARTPRRQGRCAERILRTKEAVLRIRTVPLTIGSRSCYFRQ
jgi:hypothetical protein